MKKIEIYIGIAILLFTTGFTLWLYRNEPTATIDPNDNAFQYALIDRTNTIWDYAAKQCNNTAPFSLFRFPFSCQLSYLTDHWVPNWAEGYNLPYYYSHVPQIIIVGTYRLFSQFSILNSEFSFSLFQYYHIIIYLLLCSIPLVMFLSFRILKYSWLTAGFAALLAPFISTDGLYGIDQTSFLFRGWGLSSQLFALIWLPLGIACMIRYVTDEAEKNRKFYLLATILFLTCTTAGHLGIGMMAFMAIAVIAFSPAVLDILKQQSATQTLLKVQTSIRQTVYIAVPALILLSYWIIPAFQNNDFHNISIWDPVWKFNSFGVIEVVTKLVNGELFDFGRLPVFTVLVLIGLFVAALHKNHKTSFSFSLLFVFFLIMFFGRTTLGGIIDLIPGMSEFHGHRFIVGVHLTGLFLAPIGLMWLIHSISRFTSNILHEKYREIINIGIYWIIGLFVYLSLTPHIISYATYNDTLIKQANAQYAAKKTDMDLLFSTLRELQKETPGRVYALRANEGRDFTIASTSYYMHLSTYGIPTVLWLPETWSPNSDIEQFFSEENPSHYDLYNITYVVTPPGRKPQPFWKRITETPSWTLYAVKTNGYIDVGTSPAVVVSKKTTLLNLLHLWIQSEYPKYNLFPELRLNSISKTNEMLPNFRMTDGVTYKTSDNNLHNIFGEPPVYMNMLENGSYIPASSSGMPKLKVTNQNEDTDMQFSATIEVSGTCKNCIVFLKQTFHPNWQLTVNGKKETPIITFPFLTAVRMQEPGVYHMVFSYEPAPIKTVLFICGIFFSIGFVLYVVFRKK